MPSAHDTAAADPRLGDEAPWVLSRLNRSSVAAWLPEVALLLLQASLCALGLSIVTGLIGSLVIRGDFDLRVVMRSGQWVPDGFWGVPALLSFVVFVGWTGLCFIPLLRWRLRKTPVARLYPDRVELYRVWANGDVEEFEIGYAEIGRLTLLHPGTVSFGLGMSRGNVLIPISRFVAEDEFERLLLHVEKCVPDHLYSVHLVGDFRYSRRFAMAELPPVAAPVREVGLTIGGELVVGDEHWRYRRSKGVLCDPSGEPLLRRLSNQIELRNGMHLARLDMETSRTDQRLVILFGSGEVFVLDLVEQRITVAEREIAVIGPRLRFVEPQPVVTALILALLVADPRRSA